MSDVTRVVPADRALDEALRILGDGGLVAFPTETVYGLGADGTRSDAVARIYAAKGRPSHNPLIAHVPDAEAAFRLGVPDARARILADALWPGPLTIVVPARPDCAVVSEARAGLDTVAVRVPAHPFARAMLTAFGRPVVAPSANRSGYVSPTRAEHVRADLDGRIALVVDGGDSPVGLESTVVACGPYGVRLLRPGFVLRETLERLIGEPVPDLVGDAGSPRSPGRLASHYAPRTPIRLDAVDVRDGEVLVGFGGRPVAGMDGVDRLDLSPSGDLLEAASRLYDVLRAADALGASGIAVVPLPSGGLGEALTDRLRRAAAVQT